MKSRTYDSQNLGSPAFVSFVTPESSRYRHVGNFQYNVWCKFCRFVQNYGTWNVDMCTRNWHNTDKFQKGSKPTVLHTKRLLVQQRIKSELSSWNCKIYFYLHVSVCTQLSEKQVGHIPFRYRDACHMNGLISWAGLAKYREFSRQRCREANLSRGGSTRLDGSSRKIAASKEIIYLFCPLHSLLCFWSLFFLHISSWFYLSSSLPCPVPSSYDAAFYSKLYKVVLLNCLLNNTDSHTVAFAATFNQVTRCWNRTPLSLAVYRQTKISADVEHNWSRCRLVRNDNLMARVFTQRVTPHTEPFPVNLLCVGVLDNSECRTGRDVAGTRSTNAGTGSREARASASGRDTEHVCRVWTAGAVRTAAEQTPADANTTSEQVNVYSVLQHSVK